MPTDERAKQLWHNTSALMFADYHQRKVWEEDFDELGRLLGVRWTREQARALFKGEQETAANLSQATAQNEIFFPLAAILEPSLYEHVKKTFGNELGIDPPSWAQDEADQVINLFDTSREDFLNFIGSHLRPVVANKK